MRNLRRNKKPLYLCQKYQDGVLNKYREAIPMFENYVPTNSDGDLISIGMEYPMYLRIKTSTDNRHLYHPGDRVYVYANAPTKHDELCEGADYEVYKDAMPYINEMDVMLRRLSDDNNG